MANEILLDVRTLAEFSEARIPNSVNIPLDELAERKDEVLAMDGDIMIVCASGARARVACDFLEEIGVINARVMEGGISEYHRQENKIEFGN